MENTCDFLPLKPHTQVALLTVNTVNVTDQICIVGDKRLYDVVFTQFQSNIDKIQQVWVGFF